MSAYKIYPRPEFRVVDKKSTSNTKLIIIVVIVIIIAYLGYMHYYKGSQNDLLKRLYAYGRNILNTSATNTTSTVAINPTPITTVSTPGVTTTIATPVAATPVVTTTITAPIVTPIATLGTPAPQTVQTSTVLAEPAAATACLINGTEATLTFLLKTGPTVGAYVQENQPNSEYNILNKERSPLVTIKEENLKARQSGTAVFYEGELKKFINYDFKLSAVVDGSTIRISADVIRDGKLIAQLRNANFLTSGGSFVDPASGATLGTVSKMDISGNLMKYTVITTDNSIISGFALSFIVTAAGFWIKHIIGGT